jgi:hypothetical protein
MEDKGRAADAIDQRRKAGMGKQDGTLATLGTGEGSQLLGRAAVPGVEFDQTVGGSFHRAGFSSVRS